MVTASHRFLFSGYTFQQEQEFKAAREQLRIRPSTRRCNPIVCQACGKGGMAFRSTTRDYRCRECGHIQPCAPRTTIIS